VLPLHPDLCGPAFHGDGLSDLSSKAFSFGSVVNPTQFEISHGEIGDLSGPSTVSTTSPNNFPTFGCASTSWSAFPELDNAVTHMGNPNISAPVAEPINFDQGSPGNEESKLAEGASVGWSVNAPKGQLERSNSANRKCNWPGCPSNTVFKRKYEYERHMKKHTKVISIPCPVEYCPRQGSRSFYRSDKLSDHLRTAHTENEKCRCLVEGCTAVHVPLNLLRVHASRHYVDINMPPNLATSHAFLKALGSFRMDRKCDLKKCKRLFSGAETNDLQEHLLKHSLDDRLSQTDVIREMGYDPVTTRIICPLCHQDFTNSAQFVPHLETAHLTTNVDHWLSFKRQIAAENRFSPQHSQHVWTCWPGAPRKCNYCGNNFQVKHHLELLKTSNEIRAARASILRLLPTFVDHPIFEIDRPTVHRRYFF